jgi:hypothetical protein
VTLLGWAERPKADQNKTRRVRQSGGEEAVRAGIGGSSTLIPIQWWDKAIIFWLFLTVKKFAFGVSRKRAVREQP